jgi:hypothetical protein
MARPKKTTAKKTTTRGRKATTPKAKAGDKEKMSASLKTQTASIKMLKGTSTKRPPNNPDMPQNIIDMLNQDFNSIKELLDNFSQHLRALDRMRLNGVGIKNSALSSERMNWHWKTASSFRITSRLKGLERTFNILWTSAV